VSIQWIKNPDYETPSFTVDLSVGDVLLVAVSIYHNSVSRYEYCTITATETGFETNDGEQWCEWAWSEVEWYCKIEPPKDTQ
jgi:hypothetical protein